MGFRVLGLGLGSRACAVSGESRIKMDNKVEHEMETVFGGLDVGFGVQGLWYLKPEPL